VEADIRIMGLNTTLKCGRLGAIGGALGVIAKELRRCGGDTAVQATAVVTELQQMSSLASEMAEGKRRQDDSTIDTVAQEMVIALDYLARTAPSLAEALSRLEQDSDSVAGLLDAAAADFAVRHEIGEALHRAGAEAASIAKRVDNSACDVAEPTARLLALLSRTYTVPREREIHARYALVPPDTAVAASPAPAEQELADLLF
jgi:hypothetical protein